MRAASTAWTVAGILTLSPAALRQAIDAPLAVERFGFHQRSDALLQEERIPLGARNQELLEGLRSRSFPSKALRALPRSRGQRIDPELR